MSGSKWDGLAPQGCQLVDLGRPAVFYIPSYLLRRTFSGRLIEDILSDWLIKRFGAFTATLIPQLEVWVSARQQLRFDECRQYEVAFVGKERISELIAFLVRICQITGEDCFYFKAGQYACLIYPDKK
jgi:hypothetical protein